MSPIKHLDIPPNKKTKVIKQKKFSLKFDFFYEHHPPTRHMKYKVIDFAPRNKSIMANKLLSTNLKRFLRPINSPLAR